MDELPCHKARQFTHGPISKFVNLGMLSELIQVEALHSRRACYQCKVRQQAQQTYQRNNNTNISTYTKYDHCHTLGIKYGTLPESGSLAAEVRQRRSARRAVQSLLPVSSRLLSTGFTCTLFTCVMDAFSTGRLRPLLLSPSPNPAILPRLRRTSASTAEADIVCQFIQIVPDSPAIHREGKHYTEGLVRTLLPFLWTWWRPTGLRSRASPRCRQPRVSPQISSPRSLQASRPYSLPAAEELRQTACILQAHVPAQRPVVASV